MHSLALLGVAVGLSMDSFSVSLAKGIGVKSAKLSQAFKVAIFFGGFQALMPLAGWLIGKTFASYINAFSHWVAFVLLAALGGKMILEAVRMKNETGGGKPDGASFSTRSLALLAFATSIDALAVGVTIDLFQMPVLFAVSLIGAVTFAVCFLGVWLGSKIGKGLNRYAEIFGGLMLIVIGVMMLLEGLG